MGEENVSRYRARLSGCQLELHDKSARQTWIPTKDTNRYASACEVGGDHMLAGGCACVGSRQGSRTLDGESLRVALVQ